MIPLCTLSLLFSLNIFVLLFLIKIFIVVSSATLESKDRRGEDSKMQYDDEKETRKMKRKRKTQNYKNKETVLLLVWQNSQSANWPRTTHRYMCIFRYTEEWLVMMMK